MGAHTVQRYWREIIYVRGFTIILWAPDALKEKNKTKQIWLLFNHASELFIEAIIYSSCSFVLYILSHAIASAWTLITNARNLSPFCSRFIFESCFGCSFYLCYVSFCSLPSCFVFRSMYEAFLKARALCQVAAGYKGR